jgi:spore germination protein GerM
MPAKKKPTRKKNSASIGIIFWLTFTVVMGVLFIVNYPKIQQTWNKVLGKSTRSEQADPLKETDSGEEALFQAISAAGEQSPPPRPTGVYVPTPEVPETPSAGAPVAGTLGGTSGAASAAATGGTTPETSANRQTRGTAAGEAAAVSTDAASRPPQDPRQSMRQRLLYFVRVDSTGMVFISATKRQVAASGSPLNESLAALLGGPTAQEKRNELTSLIPEGTRLLGVRVSNGTAYINFNERFLFNSFGAEGYIAQLRQVVWTATDSSNVGDNVQNVQILIDGRTTDYLGDNIPIRAPISRNSF